jgi:hypothetical protein
MFVVPLRDVCTNTSLQQSCHIKLKKHKHLIMCFLRNAGAASGIIRHSGNTVPNPPQLLPEAQIRLPPCRVKS